MAEVKITGANFQTEVLESDVPVLVDFWASWCGPCRMLGPVIEQIAAEYAGKLKVGKLNVDEEPELANRFRVMSIPMVALFRKGQLADSFVGYRPKSDVTAFVDRNL